jgi:hypothetical protein
MPIMKSAATAYHRRSRATALPPNPTAAVPSAGAGRSIGGRAQALPQTRRRFLQRYRRVAERGDRRFGSAEIGAACCAIPCVRFDGGSLVRLEYAEGEEFGLVADVFRHRTAACSLRNAKTRRLLIVPSGTPVAAAISRCDRWP